MTNPPLLTERAAYEEHDPVLGRRIWCRQMDPEHDTDILHSWMHRPHVSEFWEMDWPRDWIRDYLQRQLDDPGRAPYIGFVDETPVGYVEVYDPFADVLGAYAPLRDGDLGCHVLIGEEEYLGRYSVSLGRATMRFLFRRPEVQRLVGEPDVRNENFLSLLAFLGYKKEGEIDLPDKRAAFMVAERGDVERLSGGRRRRRVVG